jgi:hypothetical protein
LNWLSHPTLSLYLSYLSHKSITKTLIINNVRHVCKYWSWYSRTNGRGNACLSNCCGSTYGYVKNAWDHTQRQRRRGQRLWDIVNHHHHHVLYDMSRRRSPLLLLLLLLLYSGYQKIWGGKRRWPIHCLLFEPVLHSLALLGSFCRMNSLGITNLVATTTTSFFYFESSLFMFSYSSIIFALCVYNVKSTMVISGDSVSVWMCTLPPRSSWFVAVLAGCRSLHFYMKFLLWGVPIGFPIPLYCLGIGPSCKIGSIERSHIYEMHTYLRKFLCVVCV